MSADAPLLDDMLLFVEVASSGGITAAAPKLGIRKSTVSRRLSAMEERLGVRLLERNTRGLRLTEAGRSYLAEAQRIVRDAREVNRSVAQTRSAPQGTLRIATLSLFGELLAPVLAELLAAHPRLAVELALTETHVDLIAEDYDLALRTGPLADSSLVAKKLGQLRMITCASPGYLKARGPPESPDALAGHDAVILAAPGTDEVWFFGEGRRARTVRVQGRLRVPDVRAAQAAARAGLGLVRLPEAIIAADLRSGVLVPVLEAHAPPGAPVFAVYPSSRQVPAKVRAFLELLAERRRALPWAAAED